MRLITIGDVLVHEGEPDNSNPYRGHSLCGDERVSALRAFRDGADTAGYTFWHAPGGGGASRLTDPSRVDWRGLRD